MKKNSSTYCFSNSGVNFTSLTHLNGRSWQTLECKLTSQFTISYSLKCISMWCCFYVYYLTATFIDLNLPKIPAVFKYVLYGQIKVTLTNIRVWGPFGLRGETPHFFSHNFFGRNLQAFLEELCRNFYNFGDFRVPPPPRLPHTSMLTQRNGDIYCIAVLKNLKILQVWNFFKSNTVFAKFVYILCQEYFLTSYLLY